MSFTDRLPAFVRVFDGAILHSEILSRPDWFMLGERPPQPVFEQSDLAAYTYTASTEE